MPTAAKLLGLLFLMSFVAWGIIAWVHLVPWLRRHSQREALLVTVLPHMFRHIGTLALFPGIAEVPPAWAVPLAWGDGITATLAALSMVALHRSWKHANKLVWAFNLFGCADLVHNGISAVALQVAPQLRVVAYVVAVLVPGMLVFHLLVFQTLLHGGTAAAGGADRGSA